MSQNVRFWDEEQKKYISVSRSNPLPTSATPGEGSVGSDQLLDGAVTTEKIADGSITTDKFNANAKAPAATTADSAGSVAWGNVTDKPSTFTPSSHTHSISDVTNLQSTLDSKLTASQAEAQADSTATDVETLVGDFNALLAKLRAAGILAE